MKKMKIKEEKGSITVFVVVSILFFVIVATGLYINSNYKIRKQNREIEKIQENYNNVKNVNYLYQEAVNKI